MSNLQFIILVLLLSLSTALTRFVPFLIFDKKEKTPKFIDYLAKVLPASMMGLLVVYSFKDIDFSLITEILPAVIGGGLVVLVHLLKRNTILSIALGTISYMILIRVI